MSPIKCRWWWLPTVFQSGSCFGFDRVSVNKGLLLRSQKGPRNYVGLCMIKHHVPPNVCLCLSDIWHAICYALVLITRRSPEVSRHGLARSQVGSHPEEQRSPVIPDGHTQENTIRPQIRLCYMLHAPIPQWNAEWGPEKCLVLHRIDGVGWAGYVCMFQKGWPDESLLHEGVAPQSAASHGVRQADVKRRKKNLQNASGVSGKVWRLSQLPCLLSNI